MAVIITHHVVFYVFLSLVWNKDGREGGCKYHLLPVISLGAFKHFVLYSINVNINLIFFVLYLSNCGNCVLYSILKIHFCPWTWIILLQGRTDITRNYCFYILIIAWLVVFLILLPQFICRTKDITGISKFTKAWWYISLNSN